MSSRSSKCIVGVIWTSVSSKVRSLQRWPEFSSFLQRDLVSFRTQLRYILVLLVEKLSFGANFVEIGAKLDEKTRLE